jgi:hypothetical protein
VRPVLEENEPGSAEKVRWLVFWVAGLYIYDQDFRPSFSFYRATNQFAFSSKPLLYFATSTILIFFLKPQNNNTTPQAQSAQ